MTDGVCYVDASALVKLVIPEPESDSLREFLRAWPQQATAMTADVEVHRALLRGAPSRRHLERVGQLFTRLRKVALDEDVLVMARSVKPAQLRALDAIHLASALSLGDELGVFVVYDRRLVAAAEMSGVPVASPGA